MTAKHTPGPFLNSQGYIVGKGGYTIAHVNSHNTCEGAANARLIAAAPALLETLKGLILAKDKVFYAEKDGGAVLALMRARLDDAASAASAAINQAEGES